MDGHSFIDLKNLIEPVYPGLLDSIQSRIESGEREFEKNRRKDSDSYLWEHTVLVAALVLKICRMENRDPLFPVVAALFHDAGKFEGGLYKEDQSPEEKVSARIASEILTSSGLNKSEIDLVTSGLTALYDERAEKNSISNIVHDADFLSKTGYLGVANFFLKTAKRGLSLYFSLLKNLSRELTYAAVLPDNMRTSAGKELAKKRSKDLRRYFEGLIQELRDLDMVRLQWKEVILPCPDRSGRDIKFILVVPETCPSCDSAMNPEYSFEQGLKCTELVAEISCASCPATIRVAFCLPEIA